MKFSQQESQLDVNAKLPKDAVFRVLGAVADDLEAARFCPEIYGFVRNRNVPGVLACCSNLEPQSILERTDSAELTPYEFAARYQLSALIKKFPFKLNAAACKNAARKKFLEAEEQCRLFNTENYRAIVKLSQSHPKYYGIIDELREEIVKLIGEQPVIEDVLSAGRHGPGQTAGHQKRERGCVTQFYKYAVLPYSVTKRALPYAKCAIESDQRWLGAVQDWYRRKVGIPIYAPIDLDKMWSEVFTIVSHAKLAYVPKTAVTDRTIGMEATMNIFLQLAVDSIIRPLLRNWGYDLDSQEKNQDLALEGSITNELSTLDLKGASDTVSLLCCSLLLPPLWMWFLLDLRSDVMVEDLTVNGVKIQRAYRLHKMSAMGNGYTFVLESLIFGAVVRVAMRRSGFWGKSAVYGDDIVCPRGAAPFVIELLEMLGFSLNKEKSFIEGPFRESCGKDFFNGYDVRPFFITDEFETVPGLFHLYNSFFLRGLESRWPMDREYPKTLKLLRTWIPEHFALGFHGPVTEDTDTHLFSDSPLPYDRDGYRFFDRIVERPHKFKWKRKDFFFIKLMARLDGRPVVRHKWDLKKRISTGNAFDITRRSCTFYKRARAKLPDLWQNSYPPYVLALARTTKRVP